MLEQEVRRQAMLSVMGIESWLPRQQLPHAPASSPELLNWQPPDAAAQPADRGVPQQKAAPVVETVTATVAKTGQAADRLQQVRQSLEAEKPVVAAAQTGLPQPDAEAPEEQQVEIPRFSLQLLRSGTCLLLADLPLGEAFQSSDPDFQLLQDILRAARLPHAPQLLRQGEPIRWPLLTSGQLAGAQDADAARICVRDVLEFEIGQSPADFVWLLGPRAMCFANALHDAEADLFSLTAFQGGVRCWNLPSLEQLMSDRPLKPQLWHHLQKIMPHWVQDA